MEEVLEKLNKACVSDTGGGCDFESLFKNRGRQGSQDERRRWLLESQKRQRNENLDHSRGILELVEELETDMDWSCGDNDKVRYRPRVQVAGFQRGRRSYRDALMLSEWLVERPEDLRDSWYMVPCPKGTRVLVVAAAGRTKLFTKQGFFLLEGRSSLPGGHAGRRAQASVLDCVWHAAARTAYVLDVLAWNNQPMTDCDTEFRHYWLTTQLSECASLRVLSKRNHFVFSLLPKVPCTTEAMSELLSRAPMFEDNSPPLDGILLYHKSVRYTAGPTPLVGWLYPYMVTEVLGADIKVNPLYAERPPGYTTQAAFILEFEEKQSRRKLAARAVSVATTDADAAVHTDTISTDPSAAVSVEDTMDAVPVRTGSPGNTSTTDR